MSFRGLAIGLMGLGVVGCESNSITGSNVVAAVSISSPRSEIRVAQSIQLSATPVNESGSIVSGATVAWDTGDPAVATVEQGGLLTGVGPGPVTITATADGKSGTVSITVTIVPVSKIEVTSSVNPVPAGLTSNLSVIAKDSANRPLTNRQFSYSSSNTEVATVSTSGVVTGKTPGGALISVTAEGVIGTALVSVVLGPPTSLTVTTGEVYQGTTRQLAATLRDPAGNVLPLGSVEWSTSDASRVAVNNSGLITGVSPGSATITGRVGSVTASITSRTIIVKQIDGGTHHTCFLDDRGFAYCLGRNSSSEIGNGIGPSGIVSSPTRVSGGLQFAKISVGSSHACGLAADGTGYCWGWNGRGNIGDDSQTDRATPVAVSGGKKFVAISAGHDDTCALEANGDAFCWGGVNFPARPTAIEGGPKFVSLTDGYSAACALDSAGQAYCWGNNGSSQLGTTDWIGSLRPRAVATDRRFVSISSSQFMTCGLTATGETYCWGMFGHTSGGPGFPPSPPPLLQSGPVVFASLSVGTSHFCGLDAATVTWCNGSNTEGQLGNGVLSSASSIPVRVNDAISGAPDFTTVGAGAFHSCGITASGAPWCWGRGEAYGRLGDNRSLPTLLASP